MLYLRRKEWEGSEIICAWEIYFLQKSLITTEPYGGKFLKVSNVFN